MHLQGRGRTAVLPYFRGCPTKKLAVEWGVRVAALLIGYFVAGIARMCEVDGQR